MVSRSPTAAALCALTLVFAPDVDAQDVWRRPNRAMRHIHRRAGATDWHLVSIDLTQPGVRVVGTPESMLDPAAPGRGHRWRTVSEFARATGSQIAINANYYDIFHGAFTTCGLTVSNGRVWTSTYVDRRLECWWSVGFGSRGRVDVFDSHGKTYGPVARPWMTEVVTGSPLVLRDGEVLQYTSPRHALVPNPRTLLGVSADRHTLYLMVVNGREGAAKGMTCPDAARVLRDFGASDAVNLDGGGSSGLYIRDEGGLVSRPADNSERAVGNHLGIVFDDASEVEGPTPEEPAPDVVHRPDALRAAVSQPGLPRRNAVATRAPRGRAVNPAADAAPGRRAVVRAGCQGAPGPVDADTAWMVLAATALFAIVRRSTRERA